jgi:GH24 family phage-related lysozyme (muramidase)
MARVKKTVKPVDSSEVADSATDAIVSFEFGLSKVTSSDLDEFVKAG